MFTPEFRFGERAKDFLPRSLASQRAAWPAACFMAPERLRHDASMPRSFSARFRSPARAFFWVLPLALLGALGCAAEERRPETAIEYAENAKLEYEQGVRALESENWE